MYDTGKVLIGLAVFVALFASPLLLNLAGGEPVPDPVMSARAEQAGKCVESREYMRSNHMDLLNQWRNTVVREGNRIYLATDGGEYDMSLTNTCMKCHDNYLEFCNRCHLANDVVPFCWDCHLNGSEEF